MAHQAKLIDRKGFCRYLKVGDRRPFIVFTEPAPINFRMVTYEDVPLESNFKELVFRLERIEEDGLLIYKER